MLISIKTPQLIGIIAGCFVFTITIGVVVALLIASGAFSNFLIEIQSVKDSNDKNRGKHTSSTAFHILNFPMLYDNLLSAKNTLPIILKPDSLMVNLNNPRIIL